MTGAGSYAEAVRALQERGRFGIRLGLGRTHALLRELDHPERAVRGALIAGTNGKGSVLALAESDPEPAPFGEGRDGRPVGVGRACHARAGSSVRHSRLRSSS